MNFHEETCEEEEDYALCKKTILTCLEPFHILSRVLNVLAA